MLRWFLLISIATVLGTPLGFAQGDVEPDLVPAGPPTVEGDAPIFVSNRPFPMGAVEDALTEWGLAVEWATLVANSIGFALVLLLALIADLIARRLIVSLARRWAKRTQTIWDDIILRGKVLSRLAQIAPALVIYRLGPVVFLGMDRATTFIQTLALIYMLAMVVLALDAALNVALEIYRTREISKRMPLRGLVQFLKIGLYFIGTIVLLSLVTGKNPSYFLGGLGALTAVLMLIFKDPILGFVGGVQLSTNNMLQRGDWIEMPQYGADGNVLDVALTTVKVQNWDMTITTIPTYALISSSFKNWRGMSQSAGRRIKRAIHIDMTSVRFCDTEMLQRFAKIQYIREYLEAKKAELASHNEEHEVDDESLVNGRRLTNVGTFRAYVSAYIRNHPAVNQDMTLLVRQLAPGPEGLPIEVYVFSAEKAWEVYEGIQGDIFDHLLAAVAEFDLKVYQRPTGEDVRALENLTAS